MVMKKKKPVGVVTFIHPDDSAIDVSICEDGEKVSDIANYREDWDFDKHCVLMEGAEPTRFKINLSLTYRKQIAIKNAQLGGFGKGEETGFKLGNHSNQVVRSILVGIDNPEGASKEDSFIFKREGADLVSEELMRELEAAEVVDDIYSFWMVMKSDSDEEDLKKS